MHICYCQVFDTGLSLSLAGGSDVYAVLVCGSDPSSPKSAAIFKRDLIGFKGVLTDNRIVGVRYTKLDYNTVTVCHADVCAPVYM